MAGGTGPFLFFLMWFVSILGVFGMLAEGEISTNFRRSLEGDGEVMAGFI